MNAAFEPALRTYRSLLDAWNARDADGFAALFAPSGSAVGFDGSQMNGRDEIAATLGRIFTDHPTATYVAIAKDVRSLAPGVTLLRAVAGMVPRGDSELNPAMNAVQSLVLVEHDGQLRIALLQNTPAAFHGRPQAVEALTDELRRVVRADQVVVEESSPAR